MKNQWDTLFISFYSMLKIFIGQLRFSLPYYKEENNYFELVEGAYALKLAKNKKVKSIQDLFFLLKVNIYFYLINSVLEKIGSSLCKENGYPFMRGKKYMIHMYNPSTSINGSRVNLNHYEFEVDDSNLNNPYNLEDKYNEEIVAVTLLR